MPNETLTMKVLRPCRIKFDDGHEIDALTDDTYWNGFINFYVSEDTHNELNDFYWDNLEIEPSANGLIYYGGGAVCAEEVKINED